MMPFWSSFKDELLATAVVLMITAGASFYVAEQLSSPKTPPVSVDMDRLKTLGAEVEISNTEQENTVVAPVTSAAPENTSRASVQPSPNMLTQVPYGEGGSFDNQYFKVEITKPRLEFDQRYNSKRKLIVDIVLANKSVTAGLINKFTASVVKDGVTIVPQAAMSVTESKTVMPGQKLTFTATLSLIEGTDVSQIMFSPQGVKADVVHMLYAVGSSSPTP